MSYIPESDATPFVHHFGYYTQPASNTVGQRLPLASSGFSISGLSINASGQLEVNAGVCVMVQLALLMERNDSDTHSATVRWYDVTNGVYIGASCRNVLMSSASAVARSPIARAVFLAATTTTLECRLIATSGTVVSYTGAYPSTYHGRGWFSVTRYT
jgi:hypothetical protein